MNAARFLTAFIVGLIFALGLGISGMTQPEKVVGFLDLFGEWNPALAFVMIGAIGFHSLAYLFIKKKSSPLLTEQFHLPQRQDIDKPLIVGATLFGVGWGVAGYCPGPALTSLASFQQESMIFVVAMLIGMGAYRVTNLMLVRS